jgi:tripartite-type tricarboxylate transporter receptor subunit TctC
MKDISRRTMIGAALCSTLPAMAQTSKADALRLVIPFPAGSGMDITGRFMANAIERTSGRTVLVDNKPGAGAVVASLDVSRSKPDGNTVLLNSAGHATNAALYKSLPFDSKSDFTPISRLAVYHGWALLVGMNSPFKNMRQFIEAAKASPGKFTIANSGIGNPTHIMANLFCKHLGVDLVHINFKGAPANELIGGVVDCAFLAPVAARTWLDANQIRALGLSGAVRSPIIPNTPTFKELGLDVPDIPAWSGVWGPKNMSEATANSLYAMFAKLKDDPKYVKYVTDGGGVVEMMPPREFKAEVDSQIDFFRKILPPLGIEIK